jgi:hypothetical protein
MSVAFAMSDNVRKTKRTGFMVVGRRYLGDQSTLKGGNLMN